MCIVYKTNIPICPMGAYRDATA